MTRAGRSTRTEKEVYEAVEERNPERVRWLLLTGHDGNARGDYNSSPLHVAIRNGDTGIARLLCEHDGVEVDAKDDDRCTPLHRCAKWGRPEIAEILLSKGASVHSRNRDRFTPLHLCAVHNTHAVADLLLRSRADDEAENEPLHRGVHLCAQHGSLDTLRVMRDYGADLNAQNKDQSTPLHISIRYGKLDVAKALINAGADVNLKDNDFDTPLHLCIKWGRVNLIAPLIKAEADMDARNKNWLTPLHLCVVHEDLIAANALLGSGAKVDALDEHKRTPLHFCAEHNKTSMLESLLGRGASPGRQTAEGWTPLHLCAFSGAIEIATILLRMGGDPNATDNNSKTPLHISSAAGKEEIVYALIRAGAVVDALDAGRHTPLHFSAQNGHGKIVDVLLRCGADPRRRNGKGYSALLMAIEKERHCAIFELLQNAGHLIANERYPSGQTPLHIAAALDSFTTVKALIASGARNNLRDEKGKIALEYVHDPHGQTAMALSSPAEDRLGQQNPHTVELWTALDHSAASVHPWSNPETHFSLKPTKVPDLKPAILPANTTLSGNQYNPSKTNVDQSQAVKLNAGTGSKSDSDDSCSSLTMSEEWTADNPFGTRHGVLQKLGTLQHGDLFADNYVIEMGTLFGNPHIRLARQKYNRNRQVLIEFYWDEYAFEHIQALHSDLHESDHIWKMLECLRTARTGFPPSIVFEKGNQTLEEWLRSDRSVVDKKWCLRQVLTGLMEARECYYVHGDLKPGNIMFFGGELRWKLTDWNGGRKTGAGRVNISTVSQYAAPEMIELYMTEGDFPLARPSLDLWSFGVIAYETLSGRRFFDNDISLDEMMNRLQRGIVEAKLLELEHSAREALTNFLAFESEERWTAAEALQHPFFASDDSTTGL